MLRFESVRSGGSAIFLVWIARLRMAPSFIKSSGLHGPSESTGGSKGLYILGFNYRVYMVHGLIFMGPLILCKNSEPGAPTWRWRRSRWRPGSLKDAPGIQERAPRTTVRTYPLTLHSCQTCNIPAFLSPPPHFVWECLGKGMQKPCC